MSIYFLVIVCKLPPDGTNILPVDLGTSVSSGDEFTYTCKEGYVTNDDLTIRCNPDGLWSSSPPICTGMSGCLHYI